MARLFKNRETGEVLTYNQMIKQFREEYDGFDPTNVLRISDIYEELYVDNLWIMNDGIGVTV